MPERTSYAPGTPSWIDIGTDIDAAKKFYGELLGWEAADAGPVEETGGYGFFRVDGKDVAGYGPKMNPGPPFWATYVTVTDAEATAAKVTENGGSILMEPGDVFDSGKMAVCIDPTGAFFSLWQPINYAGAAIVNEPGSLCWNELNTRDVESAKAFYGAVFGWTAETHDMGPGGSYTELSLDGDVIAGMLDMTGRVPEEVPPHWLVYLAVDDCDATAAKAADLGGEVVVPPVDIPFGRFAVVRDPQGAHFGIIKMSEQAT